MAKSLRSKTKREFRSKKRESGVYAATEAARLHRLNSKLKVLVSKDLEGDVPVEDVEGGEELPAQEKGKETANEDDSMQEDAPASSKRVSTHGPRHSRREEWRTSKGMSARPGSKGMNRQGGIAARRKSGRPQRRR